MKLQKLTDIELFKTCQKYGRDARKWQKEFAFLLPEVFRRKLHRRKGFAGIHEFAAKLAGMSYNSVDQILSLYQRIPYIWEQIKTHGWSKLRVIAVAITPDTQEIWIENLNRCPKSDLEEIVRIWKIHHLKNKIESHPFPKRNIENRNIPLNKAITPSVEHLGEKYQTPTINHKISDHVEATPKIFDPQEIQHNFQNKHIGHSETAKNGFQCNDQTAQKKFQLKFIVDSYTDLLFRKIKINLEKQLGEKMSMGEIFKIVLSNYYQGTLSAQRQNLNKKSKQSNTPNDMRNRSKQPPTNISNQLPTNRSKKPPTKKHKRNISNRPKGLTIRKREVDNLQQAKCAFDHCNKPITEYHHPDRLALNNSHYRLIGLCRSHHRLAHAGKIKNEDKAIQHWSLTWEQNSRNPTIENIDAKVQAHWKHP